jgi:hypothetical protein
MASFYQVWIEANPGTQFSQIKRKMDMALDWYRLNTNYWLLYTTADAQKWFQRLAPLVKPHGYLFICKLNIEERQGWMSKQFWKWIASKPVEP